MFRIPLTGLLFISLSCLCLAQETAAEKTKRMKWWKEARFGMFIHWGTYSVLEGEWNGKKNYGEWIRESAHIPIEEYNLVKDRFNPTKFNAAVWAKMAKDAGMQYVTITTKHHEGFALFDSKFSDYDVMNTPFKRDIMKELSTAVRNEGMQMCWYHSIMDWHHPDYLPRRSWENRPVGDANMDRYVEFLHNQCTELLTKYGPIGVMWFDGEWESTWNHTYGQALYNLCRKLQPNVIVNNRVDVGRGGMGGLSDAGFAGDYGTPEQEIPATGITGVDWETCMTMNDNWGYNRIDKNFKSTKTMLQMLCDIVSKGGNYLLNIGPKPNGEFPEESVQRLKEIGAWMKVNSSSIYGTQPSLFKKLPWGRSTTKGSTIYLQVFDWPKSGKLVVPGVGNQVVSAQLLTGNKKLSAKKSGGDIEISVPTVAPDANVSVIALQLKGTPVIFDKPEIQTSSNIFVKSIKAKINGGELKVRYTKDGSVPSVKSPLYSGPIEISETTVLKARGFFDGKPVTSVSSVELKKVPVWPPTNPKNTTDGLNVSVFNGSFDKMPIFEAMVANSKMTLDQFTISDDPKRENVARLYTGFISIPESDAYQFALRSDDGSRLWIDGQLVIDNDGLHSPVEKMGVAPLGAGFHHIRVEWFNAAGGADLSLRMAPLGQEPHGISKSSLSRAK